MEVKTPLARALTCHVGCEGPPSDLSIGPLTPVALTGFVLFICRVAVHGNRALQNAER